MTENEIVKIIVDIAVNIHKDMGPGLLESFYEIILARVLSNKGLNVQRQVAVPISYQGEHFDKGFRADIIVDGKVIVELKSVENKNNKRSN